jgi:hypothetical protein
LIIVTNSSIRHTGWVRSTRGEASWRFSFQAFNNQIHYNREKECTDLTTLLFEAESDLRILGPRGFQKSSIIAISIPFRVEEISDSAFYLCSLLRARFWGGLTILNFVKMD